MNVLQSRWIIYAIWGVLMVSALLAAFHAQWALAFVSLATIGLSLLPEFFASRFRIALPVAFLVWTTLFLFASLFMGEAFDFYERLWWWDLALHGTSAIGFGLIGFIFVFMLFEGDQYNAPAVSISFVSFCFAVTIGTLWEVFEYGMDTIFGLNMQKSGLDDTMGDLMINAFGAALGAGSGFLYLKGRESGVFSALIADFVRLNRRLYAKARISRKKDDGAQP